MRSKKAFVTSYIDADNPPVFAIFNPEVVSIPSFVGKVENQNLHGIDNIDYLMITHSSLLEQTNRLAEFHRGRRSFVKPGT